MALSLFTKLITTSRTIKNSGYNLEGQLDNTDKNYELYIKEPVVRNVLTMDRSTYHTIYVTTDRTIYATGYNGQGQLGTGNNSNAYKITKVVLPNYRDITDVICGGYHTFFLTKNGEVYATGYNAYGQLGLGHTDNVYTPVRIPLRDVKAIYAGGYHSFFLTKSGELYACGKNGYGQLGLDVCESVLTPTLVKGISGIEFISCGTDHTFFVKKEEPKVLVAGYNGYGQLGLNSYTNANTLTDITDFLPDEILYSSIKEIECGSHHTLILLDNRKVYGAGSNLYGQLGLGTSVQDSTVFTLLSIEGVQDIITDAYSSIFQIDTKILYGCGHNEFGELGLGDNINRYEIIQLDYTDIWLDSLNEEIITIPEMDFNKNIFIIDGYFLSGISNYIVTLDKDFIFRVFNKYSMEEIDRVYFYIEQGILKFTKNRSTVYDENGQRRFKIEPRYEVCDTKFKPDTDTIKFTVNGEMFSYNIVNNSMMKVYEHKRICTSFENGLAVFGGDFVDSETLSIKMTNYMNQPKIKFQVYDLTKIDINYLKYAFTYYDFEYDEEAHIYSRGKKKLAFLDSNNNVRLAEDVLKNHEGKELFDITSMTYVGGYLYIGNNSGQLWSVYHYPEKKTIHLKLVRKFKGVQIVSLITKDTNNELTKDLVIDDNGRYLIMGFSNGGYMKYPLYKVPKVDFKCTGIYFINDKVYYNISIKLGNFDYIYHSNIKFLLHNTYNELEISLDEFDSNLELQKTVVFEKIALSTYNYLRLNYTYGNGSLGSVYQRMTTIKVNGLYLNSRNLVANISNYSSYDISLILQSYDNLRGTSVDIETLTMKNVDDHEFIYFNNLDKNITHINLIARYGDSNEEIVSKLDLSSIELSHKISQIGYNGEILNDFDRLFNRLYENKNIEDIPFETITSLLNGMSRKKFESVNDLNGYQLDKGVRETDEGVPLTVLSDNQSSHYRITSTPDNLSYREHYRGNIYVNGLKVPYKDFINIYDMNDGLFTTYFRDKQITLNPETNIVDVSVYSESLILGEKEIHTIKLDRYDKIIDKLRSESGYEFYLPMSSEYLDNSYFQVYFKFRHGAYWTRINDKNYDLKIVSQTSEYTIFNLKVFNDVLLKLGDEIHICVNDLDKRNEYIFRDTANNEIGAYKNYFVPLLTLNERGSIITYYTDKSENIEVYVDGYMLTPYVDYYVLNLPLHLQVPTLVLFRNPINFDRKIEISIMKESFIDAYIKDYRSEYSNPISTVFKEEALLPMLENTFDVFVNGYKIPSKYNTNNRSFDLMELMNNGIPIKNRVDYVRFYLEDNDVTRFLITLLSLKLRSDVSLYETSKEITGDITKHQFFNTVEYKEMEELFDKEAGSDGLLYFLFELVDNAFLNKTNAVIDCNDKNLLKFGDDVLLDGSRQFRLPYITDNISLNANTDYASEHYDNTIMDNI